MRHSSKCRFLVCNEELSAMLNVYVNNYYYYYYL